MSRKPVIIFIIYYGLVCLAFFSQPLKVDTDILSILPRGAASEAGTFEKFYASKINILFGAKDFAEAKTAGLLFEQKLKEAEPQLEISFVRSADESKFKKLLEDHNHRLLSDTAFARLQAGNYALFRQQALAMLYSPVSSSLLPLEKDPFLLTLDFAMHIGLFQSGFMPKANVLASSFGDLTYAYMTVQLPVDGAFSPDYLKKTVSALKQARLTVSAEFPDTQISMSGVPLHSEKAISSSMKEMNIIALASTLLILVISYFIFRSPLCFLTALVTLGASISLAFMFTGLLFDEIHVLTFAFGASLIGLCIDYHTHYFVEKAYTEAALSKIKKAILISLLSSITGFILMMFSGITLLTQMAVFASIGLLNTYVIIRFLYPVILKNLRVRTLPTRLVSLENKFAHGVRQLFKRHRALKILGVAAIAAAGISCATFDDSLQNLYRPDAELLKAEKLFASVSGTGSAPYTIYVPGENAEAALIKEEALRKAFAQHNISNYKAVSQILPSLARQKENFRLTQELYREELSAFIADMALDSAYKERMEAHLESQMAANLELADLLQDFPELAVFWGKNGTLVLVDGQEDKAALAALASEHGAVFSDRLADISAALKTLRQKSSLFISLILGLIFCSLSLIYRSVIKGLRILTPSLLAVMLSFGILGLAGVGISIFNVLALVLVICFGMDYSIFRAESQRRSMQTGPAVFIACLTTVVSFGALGLTSFAVTRALGMTLSIGILLSFILSPLAQEEA